MQFDRQIVKRSYYQMVSRSLIFIRKGEKYLLIHKKKPESFGYNKLNGVGGHMESGEDPFECAQREITEETGLLVGELDLTAILFIDTNSSPGIQVFVFKTNFLRGKTRSSQEGELCWMSLKEIKSCGKVVSDVPDLIEICEAHKVGGQPKIIKYRYDEAGQLRIVNRYK